MGDASSYQVSEREWALPRFRDHLLGRLADADDERLTTAVVLVEGLGHDLDDAEQVLIDEYLDGRLRADEVERFRQLYERGDEDNRAKLMLQRALRSPDFATQPRPAERRVDMWRSRNSLLVLATAASLMIATTLAIFYVRQNRELTDTLATVRSLRQTKTPPGRVEPSRGPIEAKDGGTKVPPKTNGKQPPVEQLAGESGDGATILQAGAPSGSTFFVSAPPRRLMWTPVPDYQSQYRIRVRPAAGDEETSEPLDSKNTAVEFQLMNPDSLVLPWEVIVLSGDDKDVLARYTIARRR